MKIIQLNVLKNVNIFSYKPVLQIQLFLGEDSNTPSCAIQGFVENLVKALPGLHEHKCSVGYRGGFVERLQEGTYLAHIFEHVVLELQTLCGDKVAYGKARISEQEMVYEVIVAYKNAVIAERCAYLAEKMLNAFIRGETLAIGDELMIIKAIREKVALGPSAAAIEKAAIARKIPVERFGDEDLLLLGQGKYRRRIWSTVTDQTNLLAADLVGNKYLTTQLLAENGVPVPRNQIVTTEGEAVEVFRSLGGRIVMKPLSGSHGRGITIDVDSAISAKKAFRLAARYDEQVLVEQYIAGRQYRFCMVNHKLVAAAERIPAYVIGDGQHTVRELVDLANRNPLRGPGHDKPLTKITIDEVSLAILHKQELAPHLVPEAKRVVQIKETANISTGGTAVDVTAIVHPENVLLAEYISKVIGLDIAGLDIIATDITRPLSAGNGAIIEVNAAPGIRMHHYPSAGQPRDVGGEIVESLFPQGCDGRIPVIAVTGTNGKTTAVRMIGHIFRHAGYRVGMSTTEGVFLNEQCLLRGDCSGPMSAKMVLAHPDVDVAVLETARGGIVRAGLGFDACNIGVVTNVSEDHLGQDGVETLDDLAYIKSLVLEVVMVSGAAIINADDRFAPQLAARVQSQIVYFSAKPHNILVRRHLGAGGKAVFLHKGKIYLAVGANSELLLKANDLPVALGGKAQHNIENALVAVSVAFAYGIDRAVIKKGLENFSRNLGRLNFFTFDTFRVCVDYGHNLAGYQAMIQTVRQLQPKRLVGVIAAPGDRRDDMIFSLGRMAGEGFDRLYIKEDADLRGRKVGEVAAILVSGVAEAGFPQTQMMTVLAERQAVEQALGDAQEGDIILIFYEQYDTVLEVLQQFQHKLAEDMVQVHHKTVFRVTDTGEKHHENFYR